MNITSHSSRWYRRRLSFLRHLENLLEVPMLVLSFVWIVLFVLELTRGLGAALELLGYVVWMLFIVDFLVKFSLAPSKRRFMTEHWLTAFALLLPALRLFRVARAVTLLRTGAVARGLRVVKAAGSFNRGMRALRSAMRRRGAGYVGALSIIVLFVGAAAMYGVEEGGFRSYADALWWTAMILTTMGSEYWPKSPEGRVLCVVLALYSFAVFGYLTASLASFFVGRDAASPDTDTPGSEDVRKILTELSALRREVDALRSEGRPPRS